MDLVEKTRLNAERVSHRCSLPCTPSALSWENVPQYLWSVSWRTATLSGSTSASSEPSRGSAHRGARHPRIKGLIQGLEQQPRTWGSGGLVTLVPRDGKSFPAPPSGGIPAPPALALTTYPGATDPAVLIAQCRVRTRPRIPSAATFQGWK